MESMHTARVNLAGPLTIISLTSKPCRPCPPPRRSITATPPKAAAAAGGESVERELGEIRELLSAFLRSPDAREPAPGAERGAEWPAAGGGSSSSS